jgi:gas vesicle protein
MSDKIQSNKSLNSGLLGFGFIIGVLIGGILTLLNLKRNGQAMRRWLLSRGSEIRQQIDSQDTVAESLRQGKEAARQQREKMRNLG